MVVGLEFYSWACVPEYGRIPGMQVNCGCVDVAAGKMDM